MERNRQMASQAVPTHDRDLTSGNIHRSIWFLAFPMVLEMISFNIASALDTYWVGQLGEAALAAVAVSMTIRWTLNTLGNGLGIGGMAVVARRIGEKDYKAAAHAASQTIMLGIAISIILAVIGFIFAPKILLALGTESDVLPLAIPYLRVTMGGLVTMILVMVNNSLFRGAGEARLSMRVLFLSAAVTVVFEPILVLGLGPVPPLGITGAAWAFVIGFGCGLALQVYFLLGGKSRISINLRCLRVDFPLMARIVRIALPSTVQMSLRSSSRLAIVALISAYGTAALAAYSVTNRLLMFAVVPCFGVGNAGGALVGQNLGARKADRAEKTGWWTSFYVIAYMIVVASLTFAFAEPIIRFFISNPTAEVVALGVEYIHIVSPSLILMGIGIVMARALDGAGNTMPAMVINLLTLWLVEVGVGFVLSRWLGLGPTGVWWGRAISGFANGLLFAIWFKRGKWKEKKV
jgi:putative MATE family efflux protein